ncbi:MAG: YbaB/EbfC family nucleoid-associated protein [Mycoplasma sp.]
MNLNNLMQQAQKMQKEYSKKLAEFEAKEFEYDYSNGSVVVKMSGALKIVSLKINPTLIDPEDPLTLEEMVSEAINNAMELVSEQKDDLLPKNPGMF